MLEQLELDTAHRSDRVVVIEQLVRAVAVDEGDRVLEANPFSAQPARRQLNAHLAIEGQAFALARELGGRVALADDRAVGEGQLKLMNGQEVSIRFSLKGLKPALAELQGTRGR